MKRTRRTPPAGKPQPYSATHVTKYTMLLLVIYVTLEELLSMCCLYRDYDFDVLVFVKFMYVVRELFCHQISSEPLDLVGFIFCFAHGVVLSNCFSSRIEEINNLKENQFQEKEVLTTFKPSLCK